MEGVAAISSLRGSTVCRDHSPVIIMEQTEENSNINATFVNDTRSKIEEEPAFGQSALDLEIGHSLTASH